MDELWLKETRTHIEDMLKHSRELVLYRQQRRGRRRIYAPRIKWSKWLYTGGTEDEALPTPARKANREGNAKDVEDDEDDVSSLGSKGPSGQKKDKEDVEKNAEFGDPHGDSRKDATTKSKMPASKKIGSANKELSSMLRLRGYAADALEWTQNSEDVLYAMKLGFALFLVLWPAFISSWNTWYSLNRGCK